MSRRPRIAFFGSSLLSAYWNGAATYYRGLIRALSERGYRVTFFEPDAFDRQQHRDIDPPDWAGVVVYPATEAGVMSALEQAAEFDVVVKASGVGVFDDLLECEVLSLRSHDCDARRHDRRRLVAERASFRCGRLRHADYLRCQGRAGCPVRTGKGNPHRPRGRASAALAHGHARRSPPRGRRGRAAARAGGTHRRTSRGNAGALRRPSRAASYFPNTAESLP